MTNKKSETFQKCVPGCCLISYDLSSNSPDLLSATFVTGSFFLGDGYINNRIMLDQMHFDKCIYAAQQEKFARPLYSYWCKCPSLWLVVPSTSEALDGSFVLVSSSIKKVNSLLGRDCVRAGRGRGLSQGWALKAIARRKRKVVEILSRTVFGRKRGGSLHSSPSDWRWFDLPLDLSRPQRSQDWVATRQPSPPPTAPWRW